MRAEAQNMRNSVEYFKIDLVRKKTAALSGFGGYGAKPSAKELESQKNNF